mmetsp:Transcript_121688/g.190924  ORF Transcript_121688/g.190924 Transcript_121688/m.190924 type:complete len:199 (+) Transcript_121688:422-1018(+)
MEVGGGTVLRAMLRQLSTAASIRNLPTPCRAPGAGRSLGGGDITPPLGVFMGLREAVSPWSDGLGDALLEVWDLDDGFALPPPLLELGSPIGGSCEISESGGTPQPRSPSTPKEGQAFPSSDEFAKLLVERLGSQQAALLPLAAAVLAGGRRFPQARPRPCAAAPGGGRWMRFRQQRRGPAAVRRHPTRASRQPSNRR